VEFFELSVENDALSFSMGERDFVKLAKGALPAQLFKFKSEDSALDGTLAFVKDLDIEPLKESLLHVDFLSVKEGTSVSVNIPLKATGESASVREGRAILNQTAYQLTVDCLPSAIPAILEVDASGLEEGQSILAKDVPLPEGATLKSSDNQVVVSLLSNKKAAAVAVAVEEVAEATDAASPEGADAPAAEAEKKD